MLQSARYTRARIGVGIPGKYHATLFNKFSKAGRPGLKGQVSIGLGMSIIKTLVEWHKGEIWFRSKEHEGTTFYIELPK
ncbi:sensor histidine kinase [Mucilaginibacter robiniae]|uniref:sensor histidine kinase n=1 Tax=Mucilaginibacter robiniae TaxID=2728022 RepID=UPI002006DC51|nr:ATP-binding protein [Mucilaginibacter robiniae]